MKKPLFSSILILIFIAIFCFVINTEKVIAQENIDDTQNNYEKIVLPYDPKKSFLTGDKQYTTFNEALLAVSNGGTIYLTNNATANNILTITKNFNLESIPGKRYELRLTKSVPGLNGMFNIANISSNVKIKFDNITISGGGSLGIKARFARISNKATLTLTPSVTIKDFYNTNNGFIALVNNTGCFNINGATFESNKGGQYAIEASSTATLNINNAIFKNIEYTPKPGDFYGIALNFVNGTIRVSGDIDITNSDVSNETMLPASKYPLLLVRRLTTDNTNPQIVIDGELCQSIYLQVAGSEDVNDFVSASNNDYLKKVLNIKNPASRLIYYNNKVMWDEMEWIVNILPTVTQSGIVTGKSMYDKTYSIDENIPKLILDYYEQKSLEPPTKNQEGKITFRLKDLSILPDTMINKIEFDLNLEKLSNKKYKFSVYENELPTADNEGIFTWSHKMLYPTWEELNQKITLEKLSPNDYIIENVIHPTKTTTGTITYQHKILGIKIEYKLPMLDNNTYKYTVTSEPTVDNIGQLKINNENYPMYELTILLPIITLNDYSISINQDTRKINYQLLEETYGDLRFDFPLRTINEKNYHWKVIELPTAFKKGTVEFKDKIYPGVTINKDLNQINEETYDTTYQKKYLKYMAKGSELDYIWFSYPTILIENITDTGVNFNFDGYQYIIKTTHKLPSVTDGWNKTENIEINNLESGTRYYLYLKDPKNGHIYQSNEFTTDPTPFYKLITKIVNKIPTGYQDIYEIFNTILNNFSKAFNEEMTELERQQLKEEYINKVFLEVDKIDKKNYIDTYVKNKVIIIDSSLAEIISKGKQRIDEQSNLADVEIKKQKLVNDIDIYVSNQVADKKEDIKSELIAYAGQNNTDLIESIVKGVLSKVNENTYNNIEMINDSLDKARDEIDEIIYPKINDMKHKLEEELLNYLEFKPNSSVKEMIEAAKKEINKYNHNDDNKIAEILMIYKNKINAEKLKTIKKTIKEELETYINNAKSSNQLKEKAKLAEEMIDNATSIEEINKVINSINIILLEQIRIDYQLEEFSEVYETHVHSDSYNDKGLLELKEIYEKTKNDIIENKLSLEKVFNRLNQAKIDFKTVKIYQVLNQKFIIYDKNLDYQDAHDIYLAISNNSGMEYGTEVTAKHELLIKKDNIGEDLFRSSNQSSILTSTIENEILLNHRTKQDVLDKVEIELRDKHGLEVSKYEGTYTVNFLLPKELRKMSNFKLAYMTEKGDIELFEAVQNKEWLSFSTKHLSSFYLLGNKQVVSSNTIGSSNQIFEGGLIVIASFCICIELIVIALKKKIIN